MVKCETCLWLSACDTDDEPTCYDYTPVQVEVYDIIEKNRNEFFAEWFDYIEYAEGGDLYE